LFHPKHILFGYEIVWLLVMKRLPRKRKQPFRFMIPFFMKPEYPIQGSPVISSNQTREVGEGTCPLITYRRNKEADYKGVL